MFKKDKNLYTDVYSFFVLRKKLVKRLENIFKLLRVDNTFKTTSENRMLDINKKLKKHLNNFFTKKVMICDFGISSGQSTYELFLDMGKTKNKKIFMDLINKFIFVFINLINLFFYLVKIKKLLMVEHDKYCLRYRFFYIFKKFDKILFFIFNFMKKNSKISEVLIKNFKKIKFLNLLNRIYLMFKINIIIYLMWLEYLIC